MGRNQQSGVNWSQDDHPNRSMIVLPWSKKTKTGPKIFDKLTPVRIFHIFEKLRTADQSPVTEQKIGHKLKTKRKDHLRSTVHAAMDWTNLD